MNYLTDKAKHRLRFAAKYLRRAGYRFDGGNFYQMVIDVIRSLGEPEKRDLRGYVDWAEEYEHAEINYWGKPRSLPRPKSKTRSGKKRT